jgi:hypothetical protein
MTQPILVKSSPKIHEFPPKSSATKKLNWTVFQTFINSKERRKNKKKREKNETFSF